MKKLFATMILSFLLVACGEATEPISEGLPTAGKLVFDNGEILFSEETLESVCFSEDQGSLIAMVQMTEAGGARLFNFTTENLEGKMLLVLGEKIFFEGTIRDPFDGQLPIGLYIFENTPEEVEEAKLLFGLSEIPFCR